MTRLPTLALIGAIQVGRMLVTAVVLCAAVEAVNYGLMVMQARRDG